MSKVILDKISDAIDDVKKGNTFFYSYPKVFFKND